MAVGAALNRRGMDARWFALPIALFAPLLGVAAVGSPVAAVAGSGGPAVRHRHLLRPRRRCRALRHPDVSGNAPRRRRWARCGGQGGRVCSSFSRRYGGAERPSSPLGVLHPRTSAIFFAGWAVASSLWAEDVARAGGGDGLRLVLNVALVFVVFAAVRDARDARWIVWGYLAAGAAAAVAGFVATPPRA